ncbi:MAG: universal stress protein [Syntrophobacteraceae bacterium]
MASPGRLLVAVDGSPHSFEAVRYVAQSSAGFHARLTLLSILPACQEEVFWQVPMDEEFMRHMRRRYEEHASQARKSAEDFLNRCLRILVEAGAPESDVDLEVKPQRHGVARDIIAEAGTGYQALVVGRRGLGKIESILLGSVSSKIVQSLQTIPVWVVGGHAQSKRILIAVDASANCEKAVDFAAPFLAGADCEIKLFHAARGFPPTLGSTHPQTGEELERELTVSLDKGITRMLEAYRSRLVDAGIASERIRTEWTTGSVSRAADILSTARRGEFGTVVLGRRGISAVREFVMGRVTNKVLNGAEGLAVWVVP